MDGADVMNIRNKFYLKAAIGYALGMMIGVAITAISVTLSANDGTVYLYEPGWVERVGGVGIGFTLEAVISGLLGVVGMGGSVMYDIEHWSLFRATFTHFVITVAAYFAAGWILDWYIDWIALAFFVAAYVLIWQIQNFLYKLQIKKINRNLKKLRCSAGEEATVSEK
ncbi:MAG: DUF3021 domain-containing protein [Lachnospiraceae bacterium]|jgi:uncharacterized membrane protein YciS (DUF1049 family)|nr:DUF3021 domain-containing protein [Lachnospiraceae bacterium]